MASIEHRPTRAGEDRWRVVWWQDGARQQQTWNVKAAAEAFRQRVEGFGNQWPPGEDPRPNRETAGMTFGQWATIAIGRRSRANERTRSDYVRDLERHFKALAPIPLDVLSVDHISAWEAERRQAGLSEKTIRNLHGFASSIMRDARSHRPPLTTDNPFDGRLATAATVRVEEMTMLNPAEFAMLQGRVPEQYRPLIQLLYGTGLRFGEATALQVADVELLAKRKTLRVTKAWKRTGPSTYVVGDPKTTRSRRTIGISPQLVELLIPLVATRRPNELIFPGTGGDRLPHINVYKQAWAPAVARVNVCDTHYGPQRNGLGLPPRIPEPCECPTVLGKQPRIHDLRHSHASNLIADGVPLAIVSRRLGHSSIQITMDRYGHLDPSIDAQVNEATDRTFVGHLTDIETV